MKKIPDTIRNRLFRLVFVGTVPIIVFAIAILFIFATMKRDEFDRQMVVVAKTVGQTVGHDLGSQRTLAMMLALTPAAQNYEGAEFAELARKFHDQYPWLEIVIIEPETHRVAYSSRHGVPSPDEPPLFAKGTTWIDRVVATGQPEVSDVFIGAVRRAVSVSTYVPILREGKVWRVLAVTVEAQRFQKIVMIDTMISDSVLTAIDRNGVFVVRNRGEESFAGRSVPADVWARMTSAEEGVFSGVDAEGNAARIAWARMPEFGWTIGHAVPERALTAALYQSLWKFAIGGFLLAAIGFASARRSARSISAQAQSLAADATHLLAGGDAIRADYGITELAELAAALRAAQTQITRQNVEQQELLATLEERVEERTALLRDSEKRFRLVAENSSELIAVLAPDTTRLYAAPSYQIILGVPSDELVGRKALDHVHPDDQAAFASAVATLAAQPGTRTLVCRKIRADGAMLWIEADFSAMTDPDTGEAAGILFSGRNITARHQAENKAALALAEAERANNAKALFLASMSHELRTPLNAVIGFAQLLQMRIFGKLSARQSEYVDYILKAGNSLLRLVEDVLDFAKSESGLIRVKIEEVDLGKVLTETERYLAPLAASRGVTVVVVQPVSSRVRADYGRLLQVMVNLGSNAIKYNHRGGWARFVVEPEIDGVVRVVVEDNGIGIDPERRDQLFQPFNRLGAEAGTIEGTGLGLSLCRRLLDCMGGDIGYEPGPDTGSRFWVRLPLATTRVGGVHGEPGPAPPRPFGEPPASMTRRLLYIEDNESARSVMTGVSALMPELDLRLAPSGLRGLQLARDEQPDVIIADIHLPDIDGYQVLQALRDDPATRHIPVLALTADALPTDRERGLAAGFDDYLVKPIAVGELLRAIQRRLRASA